MHGAVGKEAAGTGDANSSSERCSASKPEMGAYVGALKFMIENEARSIEAVSLLEIWLKKSKDVEKVGLKQLRESVLELNELREDRKQPVPEVLDDVPAQIRRRAEIQEAAGEVQEEKRMRG